MAKHRLWNTVLFLGFGAYLILCIAVQTLLFKQYAGLFQGIGHTNFIPFAALTGGWGSNPLVQMQPRMWLQLAALMIPFGLILFLWVTDCSNFSSIAGITLGFTGVLCGTNYLLTAPVFDVDFMAASLCGTFVGYSIAVITVELLYAKRIRPMLTSAPRTFKKAS